ncbi:uncharacterized protein LOC132731993 [Ruditapes philippinarum]|uniref:uncharacterized protein LOC132731993 n=1 Tax=Ruditapes philippinarum TaxID=129788 RepID=UPI00295ADCE8|nr:uncharacterized protein LOC132731993 [Ruditapes philippinarum]
MGSSSGLTDLQKSDKYQKAISLNLDCGSDTLRKMIEAELDSKGCTFKKYIKDPGVQNKITNLKTRKKLFKEQFILLNTKDPEDMDISLLSLILLELFPINSTQKSNLTTMRKKRNELAHRPKAMLDDDIPFIQASQVIIAMAKDISCEFENEMRKRIEELKNRELVRTRCSMDIILLNNESLMMKLVETGKNEQADCNDETWIKFGLTRYVRQLSKFIDIDVLLQQLKDEGVNIDKIRNLIELTYNNEEKMHQFVLHMMTEKKENLMKLCICLRKTNSLLADLVQHKTSYEKDIDSKLHAIESTRLCDILKELVDEEETSSIACEDIHILCEEKCKYTTKFSTVQESMKECFPGVSFEEKDSRFHGIKWKDSGDLLSDSKVNEDTEEIISDMPCDVFGKYLASKMEKVKQGIGLYFEKSASEECISAEIFASLTDDQIEQVFRGKILKSPVLQKHYHPAYIVKEVIRFASACINGKKNGTIHFGIKEAGNRSGEIVGVPKDCCKNVRSLDDAILSGIKISFDQKHQLVAQRCIRPVQKIPVEDDLVVFEIDIVPFSGYMDDCSMQINYPPKGFQWRKCFVIEDTMISTIEESKIDGMQQDLKTLYQERVYLEMKDIKSSNETRNIEEQKKLMKLLTGGNKYVTDAFIPIICSGDISGCQNAEFLRENISSMAMAFTSALAVLTLTHQLNLRNGIENGTRFQCENG